MAFIIPYFISHQGCPHTCLFCNQVGITGVAKNRATGGDCAAEIETWLVRNKEDQPVQLAFYGGSFTCLPEEVQRRYFEQVVPYIERGQIQSIRLSTRPDCINKDICLLLKKYRVETVELGVQSMDDRVLETSLRGHTSQHSRDAIAMLKDFGFTVGVQLLPGLPVETRRSFLRGVRELAALAPAMVRLYPALVLKNSGLERKYRQKKYQPLSLNQAVVWSLKAKEIFEQAKVTVIRVGLQHSTELEENYIAGPHHPAMGELIESRRWFKTIRAVLSACPTGKKVVATIAQKDLSAFNGLRKCNLKRLQELSLIDKLEISLDSSMERGRLKYVVVSK